MFEDLVGECELDTKVTSTLNLGPIMGKEVCPIVTEELAHPSIEGGHNGETSSITGEGANTFPASIESLGGASGSMTLHHKEVREEAEASNLLETPPPTISKGTTPSLNVSNECLSIPFSFNPSFGGETESFFS